MFLESRYKTKEDRSMIGYLITKDEKLILLTQIYSLAIMLIFIAEHQPSYLYTALAGAAGGLFIILVIRIRDYSSMNSVYNNVFKTCFRGVLYAEVITKYTKLRGKIVGI